MPAAAEVVIAEETLELITNVAAADVVVSTAMFAVALPAATLVSDDVCVTSKLTLPAAVNLFSAVLDCVTARDTELETSLTISAVLACVTAISRDAAAVLTRSLTLASRPETVTEALTVRTRVPVLDCVAATDTLDVGS